MIYYDKKKNKKNKKNITNINNITKKFSPSELLNSRKTKKAFVRNYNAGKRNKIYRNYKKYNISKYFSLEHESYSEDIQYGGKYKRTEELNKIIVKTYKIYSKLKNKYFPQLLIVFNTLYNEEQTYGITKIQRYIEHILKLEEYKFNSHKIKEKENNILINVTRIDDIKEIEEIYNKTIGGYKHKLNAIDKMNIYKRARQLQDYLRKKIMKKTSFNKVENLKCSKFINQKNNLICNIDNYRKIESKINREYKRMHLQFNRFINTLPLKCDNLESFKTKMTYNTSQNNSIILENDKPLILPMFDFTLCQGYDKLNEKITKNYLNSINILETQKLTFETDALKNKQEKMNNKNTNNNQNNKIKKINEKYQKVKALYESINKDFTAIFTNFRIFVSDIDEKFKNLDGIGLHRYVSNFPLDSKKKLDYQIESLSTNKNFIETFTQKLKPYGEIAKYLIEIFDPPDEEFTRELIPKLIKHTDTATDTDTDNVKYLNINMELSIHNDLFSIDTTDNMICNIYIEPGVIDDTIDIICFQNLNTLYNEINIISKPPSVIGGAGKPFNVQAFRNADRRRVVTMNEMKKQAPARLAADISASETIKEDRAEKLTVLKLARQTFANGKKARLAAEAQVKEEARVARLAEEAQRKENRNARTNKEKEDKNKKVRGTKDKLADAQQKKAPAVKVPAEKLAADKLAADKAEAATAAEAARVAAASPGAAGSPGAAEKAAARVAAAAAEAEKAAAAAARVEAEAAEKAAAEAEAAKEAAARVAAAAEAEKAAAAAIGSSMVSLSSGSSISSIISTAAAERVEAEKAAKPGPPDPALAAAPGDAAVALAAFNAALAALTLAAAPGDAAHGDAAARVEEKAARATAASPGAAGSPGAAARAAAEKAAAEKAAAVAEAAAKEAAAAAAAAKEAARVAAISGSPQSGTVLGGEEAEAQSPTGSLSLSISGSSQGDTNTLTPITPLEDEDELSSEGESEGEDTSESPITPAGTLSRSSLTLSDLSDKEASTPTPKGTLSRSSLILSELSDTEESTETEAEKKAAAKEAAAKEAAAKEAAAKEAAAKEAAAKEAAAAAKAKIALSISGSPLSVTVSGAKLEDKSTISPTTSIPVPPVSTGPIKFKKISYCECGTGKLENSNKQYNAIYYNTDKFNNYTENESIDQSNYFKLLDMPDTMNKNDYRSFTAINIIEASFNHTIIKANTIKIQEMFKELSKFDLDILVPNHYDIYNVTISKNHDYKINIEKKLEDKIVNFRNKYFYLLDSGQKTEIDKTLNIFRVYSKYKQIEKMYNEIKAVNMLFNKRDYELNSNLIVNSNIIKNNITNKTIEHFINNMYYDIIKDDEYDKLKKQLEDKLKYYTYIKTIIKKNKYIDNSDAFISFFNNVVELNNNILSDYNKEIKIIADIKEDIKEDIKVLPLERSKFLNFTGFAGVTSIISLKKAVRTYINSLIIGNFTILTIKNIKDEIDKNKNFICFQEIRNAYNRDIKKLNLFNKFFESNNIINNNFQLRVENVKILINAFTNTNISRNHDIITFTNIMKSPDGINKLIKCEKLFMDIILFLSENINVSTGDNNIIIELETFINEIKQSSNPSRVENFIQFLCNKSEGGDIKKYKDTFHKVYSIFSVSQNQIETDTNFFKKFFNELYLTNNPDSDTNRKKIIKICLDELITFLTNNRCFKYKKTIMTIKIYRDSDITYLYTKCDGSINNRETLILIGFIFICYYTFYIDILYNKNYLYSPLNTSYTIVDQIIETLNTKKFSDIHTIFCHICITYNYRSVNNLIISIYHIITGTLTVTIDIQNLITRAITQQDDVNIIVEAIKKFTNAYNNVIKNASEFINFDNNNDRYKHTIFTVSESKLCGATINQIINDNPDHTDILIVINDTIKKKIDSLSLGSSDIINLPTHIAVYNIILEYITTIKDINNIIYPFNVIALYAGAIIAVSAARLPTPVLDLTTKTLEDIKSLVEECERSANRHMAMNETALYNSVDNCMEEVHTAITKSGLTGSYNQLLLNNIKTIPITTVFNQIAISPFSLKYLYEEFTIQSGVGGYINYINNEDEKNRVDYNTLQINNINLSGGAGSPAEHPKGYTLVLTNLIGSRKTDIKYIQQVNEYSKNIVNSDNKKYEIVKGLRNIQLQTIYNLIKINTGHKPDVIIGNLGCIFKDTTPVNLKDNTTIINNFSTVYKTETNLSDNSILFSDNSTTDNIKKMIDEYYIADLAKKYNIAIPDESKSITIDQINNNFDKYFESITDYYCCTTNSTTTNNYDLTTDKLVKLKNNEIVGIKKHDIERDKLLYKITKKSLNESNANSKIDLSLLNKTNINEIFNLLNTLSRYFSVGRKGYLQRDFGCFTIDGENENNPYGIRYYSQKIKDTKYDKLKTLYTLNFPTFIETLLNQKTANFNSEDIRRKRSYYSENQLSYNETGDFKKILPIFEQYETLKYKNSIIDVAIRLLLVPSKHLKYIAGISITDETQVNSIDYIKLAQKYATTFYKESKLQLEERLVILLQEHSKPNKSKKNVIKINDNKLVKPKHLIDLLLETKTFYDKKTEQTLTQLVHINSKDKKLIYNFYEFINILLKLRFYTNVINDLDLIKPYLITNPKLIITGGKVERKVLSFINNNSKAKHITPKYIKKNKNTKKQYKKNTKSTLKNKKHTLKK